MKKARVRRLLQFGQECGERSMELPVFPPGVPHELSSAKRINLFFLHQPGLGNVVSVRDLSEKYSLHIKIEDNDNLFNLFKQVYTVL